MSGEKRVHRVVMIIMMYLHNQLQETRGIMA
jgi:hypothetical protein